MDSSEPTSFQLGKERGIQEQRLDNLDVNVSRLTVTVEKSAAALDLLTTSMALLQEDKSRRNKVQTYLVGFTGIILGAILQGRLHP
jgi:uncharacterized coiled-coil protein SlyX